MNMIIDAQPLSLVLTLLASYLFGALPFAVWVGQLKGIDPRTRGSKNPGASNVARTLGVKWGLLILVLDALKGYLVVQLIAHFCTQNNRETWFSLEMWQAFAGVFAVLGHSTSPFLGFKGGRGVATTGGGLLALHTGLGLLCALGWFLTLMVTQRPAWASLILSAVMLVLSQSQGVSDATQLFTLLSAVIIVIRHWSHVVKMMK